jgi:hypothetical protein
MPHRIFIEFRLWGWRLSFELRREFPNPGWGVAAKRPSHPKDKGAVGTAQPNCRPSP